MTPPNIIWLISDQHRAQALSGMGDPNLQTPTLDRMIGASQSLIAGSPVCSPFRGSLLTSLYPHKCIPAHDDPLPQNVPTIAHAFHDAGYKTAYFGKWHVDGAQHRDADTRPAFQFVAPERRAGFDCWIGYENNNAQYDCYVHGHDASGDPIERYKLPNYETDALTDLLLDHIQNQSPEQPFFAVLSVQPPHSPYVAPPEYTERHTPDNIQLRPNVPPVERIQTQARERLAGFYAMIENLDWNVSRVFDTLQSTGLADNTIVIYFSDHGDMHGSQGRILIFTKKILFPSSPKAFHISDQGLNEGSITSNFWRRDCDHTTNNVLPGRYSQRNTILLFSERLLKSGSSSNVPVNKHPCDDRDKDRYSTPTDPSQAIDLAAQAVQQCCRACYHNT